MPTFTRRLCVCVRRGGWGEYRLFLYLFYSEVRDPRREYDYYPVSEVSGFKFQATRMGIHQAGVGLR